MKSMRFYSPAWVGALVFLLLPATAADRPPEWRAPDAVPDAAVTRHVIIISLDGFRPDAIAEFDAEAIQGLMRGGSYSLEAQTIVPSKTLPSHTSMLTGVGPEVHGVTWNSRQPGKHGVVQVPTIFEKAHEAGFETVAFFGKAKFHHLLRPGSLDYWQAPSSNLDHWMATRTVPAAVRYIEHERPNLMFVHIGEADYAGHGFGWMSFIYGLAVKRADAAVGRIIESANATYGRGNYTVIITADHGGHGRDHGSADPRDTTIPWIAWGQGVRPGAELGPGIRTMDTASTALWLLGVEIPDNWAGSPVTAAFSAPAVTAARAAQDPVADRPAVARQDFLLN